MAIFLFLFITEKERPILKKTGVILFLADTTPTSAGMYRIEVDFLATNFPCSSHDGWTIIGDHDHHLCQSRQGSPDACFKQGWGTGVS